MNNTSPPTGPLKTIYQVPHHNAAPPNHTSSSRSLSLVPYRYICRAERWMMQRYFRTDSNDWFPLPYHLNLLLLGYCLDGLSSNNSTCWNLPNSHTPLQLVTASGRHFHRSHFPSSPLLWLNHSAHVPYGVFFHPQHISK